MSHVRQQTSEYNDIDTLRATVAETPGLTWLEGQTTHAYWSGQQGECSHAIRVEGSRFEVGVVKQADNTYRLAWDNFGQQGQRIDEVLGRDGSRIRQSYQEKRIVRQVARQRGRVLSRTVLPNGEVKLVVAH